MRVNFNTVSYCKYKPSFGSMGFTFGNYRDCFGINRETQNTTGVRGDINLKEFADIAKWRFRNFDTVNIMPMCVSDGTEAYMFSNAIIRKEGLEKFKSKYCVTASDVMPNVINNYAKNGLLHLYDNELSMFDGIGIDVLREVNLEDYKDKIIPQDSYPDRLYKLSDEYRKLFNFHVEDLQSRILDLKDEGNSIIPIRNSLRQSFGSITSVSIIYKLKMVMRDASILITGDYDRKLQFIDTALKDCFVELAHNIWGLREYGYVKNNLTKIAKYV